MTFTSKDLGDVGHGVGLVLRYVDGEVVGVDYTHACRVPGASFVPIGAPQGWTLVSEDPLTLSPSLLCRACGHHGFIQGGRWVPA